MSKGTKRICLVTTTYSFLLYLLKFGYNKDDIFIFTYWFPRSISKNVDHIQMPKVAFCNGPLITSLNSLRGVYENIIGYLRYFYGYIKLRILLFFKTRNYDVEVYGHAQTPFSFMFFENDNSNIIEDGLQNYVEDIEETHKINPLIDKFLHLCGIYFLSAKEALGSHKSIKNVYLTKQNNHPLIKDKVRIIDIDSLWNQKSKEEREEILRIFNIDEKLVEIGKDCVLFITQPLSEDRLLDYDEEISIYKKILDNFSSENIIIKPHPREKKDYSKIFPDIFVMDRDFPIELLKLIGIDPKTVVSVVSTAILNFEGCCEIAFYGGETSSQRINHSIDSLKDLLDDYTLIE